MLYFDNKKQKWVDEEEPSGWTECLVGATLVSIVLAGLVTLLGLAPDDTLIRIGEANVPIQKKETPVISEPSSKLNNNKAPEATERPLVVISEPRYRAPDVIDNAYIKMYQDRVEAEEAILPLELQSPIISSVTKEKRK